jgi:predicted TIM-barrel fold metal-dependent hydrolase
MALAASAKDNTMGSAKKPNHFVDAHVHLWTTDFAKYPLARGFTPQDMRPPVFLPEEILRHAEPSGVNRIVLVQMSYYGFDNSYMLEVIRRWPKVFRGIAVVDWKGSNPDGNMRDLAKKGVRGFRIYAEGTSPDTWLDEEGFDKMFRCGAKERLALCTVINPNELAALDRQCKKFPDTPVVVDHLARIGMRGAIEESDVQALCALARHPLVKVKVSAFYALGKKKPPHLDLVPVIRRVFESFGAERLMWASDCPFQVVDETYEDSISLVRDRLDFISSNDKEWMLRRTAEESFFQ